LVFVSFDARSKTWPNGAAAQHRPKNAKLDAKRQNPNPPNETDLPFGYLYWLLTFDLNLDF